jgi:hypothetical protein
MSRRGPHGFRRVGAAGIVAALVVLAGCTDAPSGLFALSRQSTGDDRAPARHRGPQGRVGQIVTECGYSHSAEDDPIVHPGRPGYSHRHDFFGNTTTAADSTLDTLMGGDTTCQKRMDKAAYWVPTLYDRGRAVTPTRSIAYYRPAPGVDPSRVRNFPADLRVVAGDMAATSTQSPDLAGWTCGGSSRHRDSPPDCPPTAPLRAVITFPDCWDGQRIDSPDHMAHMANSAGGECPPSHPVHVPQLTFAVSYPVWGGGHELSLASGPTFTLHSDFVNAWDSEGLGREIELCIHRGVVCGLASNRHESALFSGG